MRIERAVAMAAVLGALAVGFAGPAWADDLSPGKYTVIVSGGIAPGMAAGNTAAMWTVNPCGSGCAQVIGENAVTWETHLANGRWTGSVHRPDAVDCKNGTAAAGISNLSLDAVTLRGTIISTSDGPACGSPAPITTGPVYMAMDQA